MAFKFRYEALLSYRGHLKDRAEIEVSRCRQSLNEARKRLAFLKNEFHRSDAVLHEDLTKSITADELKMYSDYLTGLKEKIERQSFEVSQQEISLKKKREALLKRTKEYKVMEKLKEKDVKKWQENQSQLEQKRLNEMNILRHDRGYL